MLEYKGGMAYFWAVPHKTYEWLGLIPKCLVNSREVIKLSPSPRNVFSVNILVYDLSFLNLRGDQNFVVNKAHSRYIYTQLHHQQTDIYQIDRTEV